MSRLSKSRTVGYGGARPGAGRPSTGKIAVTIRLTPEQHKLLIELGGSKWIEKKLSEIEDTNTNNAKIRMRRGQQLYCHNPNGKHKD